MVIDGAIAIGLVFEGDVLKWTCSVILQENGINGMF